MQGAVARLSRPLAQRLGASSCPRRGFSADAAHGDAKVNCWEAPTEVARWKEEHIVFAVLGGWAIGIYSAMKIFGGKKTPIAQAEPAAAGASAPAPAKH